MIPIDVLVDRFYIRGCDNLVGVSVYISLHDSKYGTIRVLFASTYTAKQLKTIYYSLIIPIAQITKLHTFVAAKMYLGRPHLILKETQPLVFNYTHG